MKNAWENNEGFEFEPRMRLLPSLWGHISLKRQDEIWLFWRNHTPPFRFLKAIPRQNKKLSDDFFSPGLPSMRTKSILSAIKENYLDFMQNSRRVRWYISSWVTCSTKTDRIDRSLKAINIVSFSCILFDGTIKTLYTKTESKKARYLILWK